MCMMRCWRLAASFAVHIARCSTHATSSFTTPTVHTDHLRVAPATLLSDPAADIKLERSAAAGPLLYSVPVLSSCTVGRHQLVRKLWQNVLSGCHRQLITGVDGIGKSTLAAEFCDRVRQSGRFTCIQWFDAQYELESQLQHFFQSMQGRREKDVLLVLDDVKEPDTVARLVPGHERVYVIMTSSHTSRRPATARSVSGKAGDMVTVVEVPALDPHDAAAFFEPAVASTVMTDLFVVLGCVPLLLRLAAALLQAHVVTATELLCLLHRDQVMQSRTLSVSAALGILVRLAVADLTRSFAEAARFLRMLACLHVNDLSDAVLHAVVGDAGGLPFAQEATLRGVLCVRWCDSVFSMHPTVAQLLRAELQDGDLQQAVSCLATLWPRRWRGQGMQVAYSLVWHTVILQRNFEQRGLTFPASLLTLMDHCATFLAYRERRDLTVAAALWRGVHGQTCHSPPTPDTVRVARDLGRLCHFLHDERGEATLQWAYDGACTVYGYCSPEAALILGCLALYWSPSADRAERLQNAVQHLQAHLTSSDQVLSKEELQMVKETMVVLLLRQKQMLHSLHQPVAPDIEQQVRRLTAELRGTAQTSPMPHATPS